jgi:hypothetical protein
MSRLNVNTIQGPSNVIRVESPNCIYAPGHIIQVKWNLSMERFYYAVPNNDAGMRGGSFAEGSNQGGTIIRPLDITITPKSKRSFVHVEFNLFYETHWNVVFSILRDGNLIGAQWGSGYNQGKWTGAAPSRFDNNEDSTPSYLNVPWIDCPGTTGPVTYSIAVKSSDSTARSLTLNSTLTNYQFGADAYEQGCSFSIAQEIAY